MSGVEPEATEIALPHLEAAARGAVSTSPGPLGKLGSHFPARGRAQSLSGAAAAVGRRLTRRGRP